MGLVNPRENSWWVGVSVWESSIQTLLPAKPHVHLCTPSPCLHPIQPSQLLGDTAAPKLVPTQGWRAFLSYSEYPRIPLFCPLSILPSPEPSRLPRKCWKGFSASLCWDFRDSEKPPTYFQILITRDVPQPAATPALPPSLWSEVNLPPELNRRLCSPPSWQVHCSPTGEYQPPSSWPHQSLLPLSTSGVGKEQALTSQHVFLPGPCL